MLTKREHKILQDALNLLTVAILHEEYEYTMEELYVLEDKIKNRFIVYINKN